MNGLPRNNNHGTGVWRFSTPSHDSTDAMELTIYVCHPRTRHGEFPPPPYRLDWTRPAFWLPWSVAPSAVASTGRGSAGR